MSDTTVSVSGTVSTAPADAPTPGIRTSEFWLSLLAVILGALTSSGLLADGSTAMRVAGVALIVLSTLGYTAARAKVKAG